MRTSILLLRGAGGSVNVGDPTAGGGANDEDLGEYPEPMLMDVGAATGAPPNVLVRLVPKGTYVVGGALPPKEN